MADGAFLNYTTGVDADTTVGEIFGILRRVRSKSITNEFDEHGHLVAILFSYETAELGERSFRLPSHVEGVHQRLLAMAEERGPHAERFAKFGRNKLSTYEHAERVAWRVIKDWVEAQLAILESRQVSFEQVFLPYMLGQGPSGPITVFEAFKLNETKALPGGQKRK